MIHNNLTCQYEKTVTIIIFKNFDFESLNRERVKNAKKYSNSAIKQPFSRKLFQISGKHRLLYSKISFAHLDVWSYYFTHCVMKETSFALLFFDWNKFPCMLSVVIKFTFFDMLVSSLKLPTRVRKTYSPKITWSGIQYL